MDADPGLLYALNRGGVARRARVRRRRVGGREFVAGAREPRAAAFGGDGVPRDVARGAGLHATDALADIADDPDDLRAMTDDDVVEALEAVADAEERRVADEKLRRALRDLGAQVSPFITTKIPTEFEDDDTVAPWADFTPENQAAKLAELGVQCANTSAGRLGNAPPPPVPTPPRVSQSPGQFRTPPRRPSDETRLLRARGPVGNLSS